MAHEALSKRLGLPPQTVVLIGDNYNPVAIETEVFVALSSAHRLAAAAPSIPPRILYCSWLI